MNNKFRVALIGAAPDTPNMGVSALYLSAVTTTSLATNKNIEFVVFDNGLGLRKSEVEVADGRYVSIILFGMRSGKRFYRPENILTMLFLSKLGRIGAFLNQGVKLIDSCDVVFDVSGGDSFSDIYGLKRFNLINIPKTITINRGKRLILLPQTYGPFKSPMVLKSAQKSIKKSYMACARDENSFSILKEMLGEDFDSKRHFCGVDMAFSLKRTNANHLIEKKLQKWLRNNDNVKIGINISGLIYNNPVGAKSKYNFISDYKSIIIGFIKYILDNTTYKVVLIPHVMSELSHYESDLDACVNVINHFSNDFQNRLLISPNTLDASQTKWLISKMDWFCGTRMHSTIAALSSGVPTASISYSDKTKGVFQTCKQGELVFDPRELGSEEIISELINAVSRMESTKISLTNYIDKINLIAVEQMKMIFDYISIK